MGDNVTGSRCVDADGEVSRAFVVVIAPSCCSDNDDDHVTERGSRAISDDALLPVVEPNPRELDALPPIIEFPFAVDIAPGMFDTDDDAERPELVVDV